MKVGFAERLGSHPTERGAALPALGFDLALDAAALTGSAPVPSEPAGALDGSAQPELASWAALLGSMAPGLSPSAIAAFAAPADAAEPEGERALLDLLGELAPDDLSLEEDGDSSELPVLDGLPPEDAVLAEDLDVAGLDITAGWESAEPSELATAEGGEVELQRGWDLPEPSPIAPLSQPFGPAAEPLPSWSLEDASAGEADADADLLPETGPERAARWAEPAPQRPAPAPFAATVPQAGHGAVSGLLGSPPALEEPAPQTWMQPESTGLRPAQAVDEQAPASDPTLLLPRRGQLLLDAEGGEPPASPAAEAPDRGVSVPRLEELLRWMQGQERDGQRQPFFRDELWRPAGGLDLHSEVEDSAAQEEPAPIRLERPESPSEARFAPVVDPQAGAVAEGPEAIRAAPPLAQALAPAPLHGRPAAPPPPFPVLAPPPSDPQFILQAPAPDQLELELQDPDGPIHVGISRQEGGIAVELSGSRAVVAAMSGAGAELRSDFAGSGLNLSSFTASQQQGPREGRGRGRSSGSSTPAREEGVPVAGQGRLFNRIA